MERCPRHVVTEHLQIDQFQKGCGLFICPSSAYFETVAGWLVRQKPTHILRFDFGFAFAQRMLNVFILPTFVIPQTLNQVIKRLLEPI